MSTLKIRDPYGKVFEIAATARAFWANKPGHTIIEPSMPEPSIPNTKTIKAGSRPAQSTEE